MKKKYINILFVLAAAMLSAACGKEPLSSEQEGFSVSISANLGTELELSTRTSLSGASTLWTAGDQISVNGNSLTLVSGEGTGAATFKATFSGKGAGYNEYLAGYPAASTVYTPGGTGAIGSLTVTLPDEQTYDPTSTLLGQMPMAAFGKADSNGNLALNFKNAANILKVKLWNTSGRKVTKIEISADNSYLSGTYTVTPNGNDNVTISDLTGASRKVTLTCPTAVSVGSTAANATVFHVLLPKIETEGTVLTFRIYDEAGYYQTKTMTVGASHLLHTHAHNYIAVTVANEFVPTEPAGVLPGLFSIAVGKQVQFSQGNLQYKASTNTWRFAEHQYDYVGNNLNGNVYEGGVKCNNALISSSYNGWIDLFGWVGASSTALTGPDTKYGVSTSTTYSHYGNVSGEALKADWGTTIDNFGTWYTMSSGEWTYLLSTRTVNGGTGEGHAYQRADINSDATSVYGLIIYPDNYTAQTGGTTYTTSEWIVMENAGCVFLSPVGRRHGSDISNTSTHGNYYSSTAANANNAYYLGFYSGDIRPADNTYRCYGRAVRLVRNATSSSQVSTTDFELEPSVINW